MRFLPGELAEGKNLIDRTGNQRSLQDLIIGKTHSLGLDLMTLEA